MAASINTKPGSSHKDDNIKPLEDLIKGNTFSTYPNSFMLLSNLLIFIYLSKSEYCSPSPIIHKLIFG